MNAREPNPEERLAEAYAEAPDCPPPEVFLEACWSALPAEERSRIEEHARKCPACASERELARSFDEDAESLEVSTDDVDWIVSRLETRRSAPRSTRWRRWGLATAAVIVLGVAVTLLAVRTPGPVLPDPGSKPSVKRSATLQVIRPVGEILDFPDTLEWEGVAGALEYRVRIVAIDGKLLWEKTVRHPHVALPEQAADVFHRGVRYRWFVEALDGNGALLARSGPVEFSIAIDADRP